MPLTPWHGPKTVPERVKDKAAYLVLRFAVCPEG
jgi:hypothetical protein